MDNADNTLQPYVDYLPKENWKTLVTSREKMDERFVEQALDKLSFEEAKALFEQYFTKNTFTDDELQQLCDKVDFHTLTLELLAKTLEDSFELQNISDLILYLQENRLDAEDLQERVFTNHSKAEVEIYAHLLNAFTLAALDENEKWLLLQFAVMPPIPHNATTFIEWIKPSERVQKTFLEKVFN